MLADLEGLRGFLEGAASMVATVELQAPYLSI